MALGVGRDEIARQVTSISAASSSERASRPSSSSPTAPMNATEPPISCCGHGLVRSFHRKPERTHPPATVSPGRGRLRSRTI